jgi:hypothetical protein
MLELVAAAALAPWAQPVRFRPLSGWQTGHSPTITSTYGPVPGVASPKESIAWTVKGARFRDRPSADPPARTLERLPARGILVSVVIYESGRKTRKPIELRLARARRFPCCDGTYVAGGEYGLGGSGPHNAYSVIVRVYFGSPPTRGMRAQAQRALDRVELPPPRR